MAVFQWIFDTDVFAPRLRCGPGWDATLVGWTVAVNAGITACYLTVPAVLLRRFVPVFRRAMQVAPERLLVVATTLAFAGFVGLCGLGHTINQVLAFWWPAYRFFALWETLTFLVSAAGVMLLCFESTLDVFTTRKPPPPDHD